MPTLYPENTTYQAGGRESISSRFPTLLKDIKSRIETSGTQAVEQQRQRLARAATMFQPPSRGLEIRADVSSGALTPPLATQLTEGTSQQTPIPSGYSGFYTGNAPESMTGVLPSKEAYIRSLPSTAGGGEYVVDPTQRGQLIKSVRGKDNAADVLIRGGLSPLLYQIDHIVPLWAGGADTISNRQVLDVDSHQKKTRAQSVAYTLLANNKINLNEAKQLALSWDTRDTSHIQDPDDNGFVDLRSAEEAYSRWQKDTGPRPVTLKEVIKGIPAAVQKFGEGWLPAPVREFVKGAVSGVTAGWVPYQKAEYKPGVESALGTIGGMAGQVTGTIYSFMKFAKLASKAASMAKDVGMKWLGRASSASLSTDIGTASIENVKRLANKERLGRILRDAGLFTVYGQLSKQEENTVDSRMKRFFFDTAYGGILGGATKSLSGYSTVAAGTLALSLMEGEDIEDAVINASIMTGLHGLGGTRAKKIEERLDEEASKAARGVLNKYLGDKIPTLKKGEKFSDITITPEEAERLYVEALNKLGNTYLSTNNWGLEDLAKERAKIVASLQQLVNRNLPPEARRAKATQDIQSTIGLLNSEVDAGGFRTPPVLSKVLDDVPLKFPDQPISTSAAIPGESYAKGVLPVTGLAKDTVGETIGQNLNRFIAAHKAGQASNRVILVSRPEIEPIIRGVNNVMPEKEIKEALHRPSSNPQNNVEVFAIVESPKGREYLPIGWLSRRFRIEDAKYSFNKNYEKMVERIRTIIKQNKDDPQKMQTALSQDKAKIDIDEMDVPRIIQEANTLSDDALMASLKPKNALIRFNAGFNKDTVAEELRRKNLPFVTAEVTPESRWLEAKAPESGEPVIVINIGDKNWVETLDIMKGTARATAESQATPKLLPAAIRERQVSQNITSTIREMKQSVQEDADILLANAQIPKMGPEKGVVEGMLAQFKTELANSKTPQELKENINKVYGEVIDDAIASELFSNKGAVRVRDVFDILTDAHNAGRTNETFDILHQKVLTDFFTNPSFARSPVAGTFLDAPLLSQKTLTAGIPPKKSVIRKEIPVQKAGAPKLEGLTPAEQAGVERARQTGGLFMTAEPAPAQAPPVPAPVSLAEKISKTAVTRKQPTTTQKAPTQEASKVMEKQAALPIAQPPKVSSVVRKEVSPAIVPPATAAIPVSNTYKGITSQMQKIAPSDSKPTPRGVSEYEKTVESVRERLDESGLDTRPEAGAAAAEKQYQKEQLEEATEFLQKLSQTEDPELKKEIEDKLLTIAQRNEIRNPAVTERIMNSLTPTVRLPSKKIITKEGVRDFAAEEKETAEALQLLGFSNQDTRDIISKQKSVFIEPVAQNIKGVAKKADKKSYEYGFNKTLDEAFSKIFGKNWGSSWVLNSYFTSSTKKGNRFLKDLYSEYNNNLHYKSQWKPFVEEFVPMRRETVGGMFSKEQKAALTEKIKAREQELDAARESREQYLSQVKKAAEEGPEGEMARSSLEQQLGGKFDVQDLISGNVRIKDVTQLESDLLTDLTKFDEILMGELYSEVAPNVRLNAIDGAQDAIAFIATLVKRINRDRIGSGKELFRFSSKELELPIRKELKAALAAEVAPSPKGVAQYAAQIGPERPQVRGGSADIKEYKNLLRSMYKSE